MPRIDLDPPPMPAKALFLDRDGVLIDYQPYLGHPDQVSFPEGADQALWQWQAAGYLLIVITNQSGIGRGYFTWADMEAVHQRMRTFYAQRGITFTDIIVCPHHPADGCTCRKPSPAMVLQAAQRYRVDLSRSFFVGDNLSDLTCAHNAQCQAILVLTGLGERTREQLPQPDSPNHVMMAGKQIPVVANLLDTLPLLPKPD